MDDLTFRDILTRLDTVIQQVGNLREDVIRRPEWDRELQRIYETVSELRSKVESTSVDAPVQRTPTHDEQQPAMHPSIGVIAGALVGGTLIEIIKSVLLPAGH